MKGETINALSCRAPKGADGSSVQPRDPEAALVFIEAFGPGEPHTSQFVRNLLHPLTTLGAGAGGERDRAAPLRDRPEDDLPAMAFERSVSSPSSATTVSQQRSKVRLRLRQRTRYRIAPSSAIKRSAHTFG